MCDNNDNSGWIVFWFVIALVGSFMGFKVGKLIFLNEASHVCGMTENEILTNYDLKVKRREVEKLMEELNNNNNNKEKA